MFLQTTTSLTSVLITSSLKIVEFRRGDKILDVVTSGVGVGESLRYVDTHEPFGDPTPVRVVPPPSEG